VARQTALKLVDQEVIALLNKYKCILSWVTVKPDGRYVIRLAVFKKDKKYTFDDARHVLNTLPSFLEWMMDYHDRELDKLDK
jgi:hypothetical protein